MLDILVAYVHVAYNMILERSCLNALGAIPSTYHMIMKFLTTNRVGDVRGDLRSARECYMASIGVARTVQTPRGQIKEKAPLGEAFSHGNDSEEEREERPPLAISFLLEESGDPKMAKLVDKLEEIPLREDCPDRCIKISVKLKDPRRGQILALIRQYVDVFTWTCQDMPGVDPEVMTHRLGIGPGSDLLSKRSEVLSRKEPEQLKQKWRS